MWPTHCVVGTKGCEYHPDFVRKDSDIEVLKGQVKMVESYSAFGGEGEETGLTKILKDKHVTDCYVVGLAWDYCVGSTAYDSAQNGYKTFMIKEATRSVNDATKETMN